MGVSALENFDIQPIPSKPGLHFERIGNLQFYLTEWTLVTFVSLEGLEQEYTVINRGLARLKSACDNPGFSYNNYFLNFTVCTNDVKMLEINFLEISKSRRVIRSLVGHRDKRGLINAVGSIQKFLFGTLSADDGEYYDSQLQQITGNLGDSLALIRDQSQVVQASIDRYNRTILDAQFNEQLLFNKTKELRQEATVVKQKLSTLSAEQLVDECAARLMYLITKYRNDVDSLTEAILFAKIGALHPHVLTPDTLIDSLIQAAPHLPYGTRFPVPLSHNQSHVILGMLRLTAYFSNGNLVFLVHVPLVRPTSYEYYSVNPLPFLIENNTYGYIKPDEPYFLVDSTHTEFSIMSKFDLSRCYTNDYGNDVVCKGTHPLLQVGSSVLCTASMFYLPTRLPLSCETRILNLRTPLWQPLASGNGWIFCLHNPVKVTIQCPQLDPTEVTLRDIGTITLAPSCTGFSSNYVLMAKHTMNHVVHTTFIPNFNISLGTELLEQLRAVNFSDWPMPASVALRTLRTENLDLVSTRLEEIAKKAEEVQFRNKLQAHSTSYFLTFVAVGVVLTLLVVWKFRRFCRKSRQARNETIINFNSKTQSLTVPLNPSNNDYCDPEKPPIPSPRVILPEEVPLHTDSRPEPEQQPRRNLLFPV